MSVTGYAVNMERLTADGILAVTGWGGVSPTEKVSALFDRTGFFHDWRTYTVAYGRQRGWDKPTELYRAPPITGQNNYTMQELFANITLEEGESYFLLISKFDVTNTQARQFDIDHAIKRFPQLYGAQAETRPVSDLLHHLLHLHAQ